MKLLMLKLLTILVLSSTISFASNIAVDTKVLNFLNKSINTGDKYKLKDVSIVDIQDFDKIPGWKVYFVKIDLELTGKDKSISITDKIFTDGNIVTKDFVYIDTRSSIKDSLFVNFDEKLYNKSNLIAGTFDAVNKLVVFSDPLCPFCMNFMPEIINFVAKYPNDFALFYYHFPLNMHPNSRTLIKAGIVASREGIKDVILKTYEEVFDFEKVDEQLVLDAFNKVMGTKITLDQINKDDIVAEMQVDINEANKLMLTGTPTLYTNGKLDKSREVFEKLKAEKK